VTAGQVPNDHALYALTLHFVKSLICWLRQIVEGSVFPRCGDLARRKSRS